MIGWTSTPLAGGGRGAGADHASANMIPTNLIMMKGAQVVMYFQLVRFFVVFAPIFFQD